MFAADGSASVPKAVAAVTAVQRPASSACPRRLLMETHSPVAVVAPTAPARMSVTPSTARLSSRRRMLGSTRSQLASVAPCWPRLASRSQVCGLGVSPSVVVPGPYTPAALDRGFPPGNSLERLD